MKRTEFIERFQKLTEEQKQKYEELGYYAVSSWDHYGMHASFCLSMQGAKGGYYIPISWLLKQKKYSFKWAKCFGIHFVIMKDAIEWGKEFWGVGYGRVINVADLRKIDGTDIELQELQKDVKECVHVK